MVETIKANAAKLNAAQVQPYYALVIMNLRSLNMVLAEVDKQLLSLSDDDVLKELLAGTPGDPSQKGNNSGQTPSKPSQDPTPSLP